MVHFFSRTLDLVFDVVAKYKFMEKLGVLDWTYLGNKNNN